jgi:hypothetical protein
MEDEGQSKCDPPLPLLEMGALPLVLGFMQIGPRAESEERQWNGLDGRPVLEIIADSNFEFPSMCSDCFVRWAGYLSGT